MTRTTECPDIERLHHVAIGVLPDDQAKLVQQHVQRCSDCLEMLNDLRAWDTLVKALQDPGSKVISALRTEGVDANAIIQRLREQFQDLNGGSLVSQLEPIADFDVRAAMDAGPRMSGGNPRATRALHDRPQTAAVERACDRQSAFGTGQARHT